MNNLSIFCFTCECIYLASNITFTLPLNTSYKQAIFYLETFFLLDYINIDYIDESLMITSSTLTSAE